MHHNRALNGRRDCDAEMLQVFDADRAEVELGATVMWTPEDMPEDLLRAFTDQWQLARDGTRRGIVEVIL